MPVLSLAHAAWTFRDCAGKAWLPAVVPGCVHTDLRRAEKIPDLFWGTNENDLQWIDDPAAKEWLVWMKKYYSDGDHASRLLQTGGSNHRRNRGRPGEDQMQRVPADVVDLADCLGRELRS